MGLMGTRKGGIATMGRLWFGAAMALTVALSALAFAALPAPDAAAQQAPTPRPNWTPHWSPECARLDALYRARSGAHQSLTNEESSAYESCMIDAFGYEASKPWEPGPEWGPRRTPSFFIKRVFPLPTPDASP